MACRIQFESSLLLSGSKWETQRRSSKKVVERKEETCKGKEDWNEENVLRREQDTCERAVNPRHVAPGARVSKARCPLRLRLGLGTAAPHIQ